MSALQQAVMEETERRMGAAVQELQAKYSKGLGGGDNSQTGPTGDAYKQLAREKLQNKKMLKAAKEHEKELIEQEIKNEKVQNAIDNDENFEEQDSELERLRTLRLKELQLQKEDKLNNLGKGHGTLRDIIQDEFLSSVTSSNKVICLFYHKDFERCKIMTHHLEKIAPRHIETKFIKIDAEKAPFFVQKLIIRTMPTLVCFVEGVAIDKIMGFEGLIDNMSEGKEDEWPTINLSKLLVKKNMINGENVVDEDLLLEQQRQKIENMRSAYFSNVNFDEEDSDFDATDL